MPVITGDSGNNELVGTEADDVISGLDGDDDLSGLGGSDTLDGGDGYDSIRYVGNSQGVVVTFTGQGSGTVEENAIDTDSFTGIESVVGSQYGDVFTNSSSGYARFRGLDGIDTYNGSETGFDFLDFLRDANFGGTGGVTVDLRSGTAIDGFGNLESLSYIDGARGTEQDDFFIGDDGDNQFRGEGGNDDMRATGGSDSFDGGAGSDSIQYNDATQAIVAHFTGDLSGYVLEGSEFTDTFVDVEAVFGTAFGDTFVNESSSFARFRGFDGVDSYTGSASGFDMIDFYRDARYGGTSGVTVDLAAGTGTDGFGNVESFSNIDGVRGTDFNDVLTGSAGANTLDGAGGADLMRGLAGDDVLVGSGADGDTADYSLDVLYGATHGIRVNQLGNGNQGGLPPDTVIDSFGYTDTIVDVRNIIATEFDDEVYGGTHGNTLVLGDGDDYAFGNAGNDTLYGGAGSDRMDGGADTDTVVLGGLNGGGHDLLQFGGVVYALDLRDHSFDTITNVEQFQGVGQTIGLGAVEGFDPLVYAASYNDLAQVFRFDYNSALSHYVGTGYFEGREATFNAAQYLANYQDLQAAFGTNYEAARNHFLASGVDEHRLAEDPLDYIASYGDLIQAFGGQSQSDLVAAGLNHYRAAGFDEGRRGGIDFDVGQYLENYGDLQSAFGGDGDAATAHYINAGYGEHRLAEDPLDYIASYGDLIEAFGSGNEAQIIQAGLVHYQSGGWSEGREADFDVDSYLANYDDLRAAFADGAGGYDEEAALLHFIHAGYAEGRTDDLMAA
ncbi:hypothetical protein [Consotaella salsifontis]|uniref:Hemolysin-type calcium-binding repeat-containing protein n=1 Tax=Consotaella salsifontis TaxID=1365950 RepID=A0A1T4P127_9HYPH|nr:hypothetical protein [Consotaella salsifontis]SJZ85215.1 hypothetical protein SAMN05428963_103286 [Consotaella salsifontis]